MIYWKRTREQVWNIMNFENNFQDENKYTVRKTDNSINSPPEDAHVCERNRPDGKIGVSSHRFLFIQLFGLNCVSNKICKWHLLHQRIPLSIVLFSFSQFCNYCFQQNNQIVAMVSMAVLFLFLTCSHCTAKLHVHFPKCKIIHRQK